jgi:hypothetical protein
MELVVEAALAQPRYVPSGQIAEIALSRIEEFGCPAQRSLRTVGGIISIQVDFAVLDGLDHRVVELTQKGVLHGLGIQKIFPGDRRSVPGKLA